MRDKRKLRIENSHTAHACQSFALYDLRSVGSYLRSNHGYTLIELVVVILIIGIALSLVLPGLEGVVPEYRIKSAARRIASTVQLARSQAISTGRTYHIVYDLTDNSFRLLSPPAIEEDDEKTGQSKPEVIFREQLGEGIKFHEVDVEERFRHEEHAGAKEIKISASPLGFVTPHVVFLEDAEGRKYTISVNPVTGVSHIYDKFERKSFIEEELFR